MKQKAAKTDFSEQNLPHNRKEVFFDCVKLYWQKLLLLGLIMLACAVPLLTVSAVCDTVQQGLSRQLEDGVIDKVAYKGQAAWLRFAEALIDIPCFVIVCVGLSGAVRVTRQMIWAEPLFFANDFADGIKQNWLTFCLCGFLVSLLNVYLAFAESSGGGLPAYLPLGVVANRCVAYGTMDDGCVIRIQYRDRKKHHKFFCAVHKNAVCHLAVCCSVCKCGNAGPDRICCAALYIPCGVYCCVVACFCNVVATCLLLVFRQVYQQSSLSRNSRQRHLAVVNKYVYVVEKLIRIQKFCT